MESDPKSSDENGMMIYTAQRAAAFAAIAFCLPGHGATEASRPAESRPVEKEPSIRAHTFGSGSPDRIGERPHLSVSSNDEGLELRLESRFADTDALLVWSYGGDPREGRVLFASAGAYPLGATSSVGSLRVTFLKGTLPVDQKVLFQVLLSAPGDPSTRGVVAVRDGVHREQ